MNQVMERDYGARFPSREDDISLVEIGTTMLRNWRVVAVGPVILALIVALWTISQDRMFVASASFMPQASDGRTAGGAAAIAQQFGVNLGSDRPGQSPQFYVDLLRNGPILRTTVESEYEVATADGGIERATLIDLYGAEGQSGRRPAWRKATEHLLKNLSASVGRETGVVSFTVAASQPALAEQVAERVLDLLNDFNMEVRQTRAEEEGRFISGRVAEASAELLTAEGALQNFLSRNREFRNSPELVFEHDRLQRQVAMRQEVYTSLLRSREEARIDAVRDTPLFAVIEHPAGTAEPRARGTIRRAVLAFMLGLMLAVFFAVISEFTRRGRRVDAAQYNEFQALAREAWQDLRRPSRWLRGTKRTVPSRD